jgi:hypothetical protein
VRLFEERLPVALGGDEFVKLFNLIAQLDGERIRLERAGVSDGLHIWLTSPLAFVAERTPTNCSQVHAVGADSSPGSHRAAPSQIA